ncbi:MAG: ROK family protein [Aquificae bacterium]|nr:ROK family protein [Aquificota bacterium]
MLKGVDIGGSFIKVLWEDQRKEKHFIRDIKSDREKLLKKIKEVVLEGRPSGVGIAVAGFTSSGGKVFKSPNIPVLDGIDLAQLFSSEGIPVAIGNDVSLGAFGEWFFDHRQSEVLVLVAIGTGLGGGLVVEGRPFFGVCGSAMEIGHHIISKDGYPCNCGRRGCWEAYCSSYGLERIYRDLGGGELRDYRIAEKALEGDELALRAVERFKDFLITGLMNMVHIFNPDTVVLGGGVIENLKPLLRDIEERVKEVSVSLPASCVSVKFSSAGEFLGSRGALAFIKTRITDIKS